MAIDRPHIARDRVDTDKRDIAGLGDRRLKCPGRPEGKVYAAVLGGEGAFEDLQQGQVGAGSFSTRPDRVGGGIQSR